MHRWLRRQSKQRIEQKHDKVVWKLVGNQRVLILEAGTNIYFRKLGKEEDEGYNVLKSDIC